MPTEFWYPILGAEHDIPAGFDDFDLKAGTNKNSACRPTGGRDGPMVHDDAVSYIEDDNGQTNNEQAQNIDWPGPMSTYDGVLTAGMRHADAHAAGGNRRLYFTNAAGTAGGQIISKSTSASWATTAPVDVSNAATFRPDGGSWSAIDFKDDKTIFTYIHSAGAHPYDAQLTSVWGEISYTPAEGGGFVFLLGLLPPLVGIMDFSHFTKFLSWRRLFHPRHTAMTPTEVMAAWRELKERKNVAYQF